MKRKWGLVLGCCIVYALIGMESPPNPDYEKLIQECKKGTSRSIAKLLTQNKKLSKEIINVENGKSALAHARTNGHNKNGEIVAALYKHLSQDQKNFLLRKAASNGNVPLAQESITNGAAIEHECNIPPFQLAAKNGHKDIIALFYMKRPEINKLFNYGLAIASQRGDTKLVNWFIKNGAQPGKTDPDTGKTAAQLAADGIGGKGDVSTLKSILDDLDKG